MKNSTLLILGLMLFALPAGVIAASSYRPMYFPDLETAFRVPARGTWYSPSGNSDPDSLNVPTSWYSPTTTNYTEFLKVPSWKSWKPLSVRDWDTAFRIPWK
ncbi:MAG: hypothetical protein A4E38_01663 [Methanoregulaceae archaeon PtaB.Bin108]|nr:MAG: hypothetical protein A4E38_01663 [Methanoregulaceae archaeon PtaB.Bin108]